MSKRDDAASDFFLFLIGGALFSAGMFLFTNQVVVGSGFLGMSWGRNYPGGMRSSFGGLFSFGSGQGFGLLMIPFGLGLTLIVADAFRKVGWFLVWASCAAIGAGVLQSLLFSFRPTSLWSLMAMIVMIGGGGGLMFRSLKNYQEDEKRTAEVAQKEQDRSLSELKKELEELKATIKRQ
jgi:hypothetical protein